MPPQDLRAEECVLGSMLLEAQAVRTACSILTALDFYSAQLAGIFRTMVDLHARGIGIDLVTVSGALSDQGALEEVGGDVYLATLQAETPSATMVPEYCRRVKEMALRRRERAAAQRFVEAPLDPAQRVVLAALMTESPATAPADLSGFLHCAELVQDEIPEVPSLAVGLLPKLGLGSLTADVGTMKTWAMLDASISVAIGEPIWGRFPVPDPGPVIYLDEECGRAEITRRLTMLVKARGINPDLPLRVNCFGGYLLDDPNSLEALKRDLSSIGPCLVILDSLIRFHTQDENSSQGMAVVSGALRSLSQDVGTAVISITHPRKLSMVSNEALERVRGSKEIPAGLDVCLFGRPLADGSLVVETAKMRHGERPVPFALRLDEEPDGGMHITNLGDVDEVEDKITQAMESMLRIVTDAGGTLDRPTLMERCEGNQRTKTEALRRLVDEGALEKAEKRGRRQLYRLPGQGLL